MNIGLHNEKRPLCPMRQVFVQRLILLTRGLGLFMMYMLTFQRKFLYREVNTAMLTSFELNETIDRIRRMELYFDIISFVMNTSPRAVLHDDYLTAMLSELTAYYDGGQWLKDYQLDEQGELPSGLRRGVLSEDGLDNLLCDIRELTEHK